MTSQPSIVGSVAHVAANAAQLPTITTPTPPIEDRDYYLVAVGNQDSSATADYTNDASMARVGAPFANATTATRVAGVWGRGILTAGAAPGTVTFTRTGAGTRQVGIGAIVRKVDLDHPVDVASSSLNTAGTTTATASGLTVTVDDCIAIAVFSATFAAGQSSVITNATAGWTQLDYWQQPTTGLDADAKNAVAVYWKAVDAGATGDCVITYTGTPAQRTGQMVVLRGSPTAGSTWAGWTGAASGVSGSGEGSATGTWGGWTATAAGEVGVTGTASASWAGWVGSAVVPDVWTIARWRTEFDFPACAHRGAANGHTRSEFSFDAYDNAIVQGFRALEVSAHRTSDGEWVCNHDPTTNEQYTTNATIASSTLATLQGLTRRYGDTAEPIRTLAEVLDRYSDYVLIVENKTYANQTEFRGILNAADPTHERIVWKSFYDATSAMTAAKSDGFTTWAYFFGTADAVDLPTFWGAHMDWVGLSSGPTNLATDQEWFDWCAARDIPVLAHIVREDGDWLSMVGQGAEMAMVNNDALAEFPGAVGQASGTWGTWTATAAGTVEVVGTGAGSWGGWTASSSGTVDVTATATATWAGWSATVEADVDVTGTAAGAWTGWSGTATGEGATTGTATGLWPGWTATATGERGTAGSASGTWPGWTGAVVVVGTRIFSATITAREPGPITASDPPVIHAREPAAIVGRDM